MKNQKMRSFLVSIFLLLFAGFFNLPAVLADEGPSQAAEGEKEFLTAEELLKTEAGKLFITRQYDKSLEEFKKLAEQYPKDIPVHRYIGACYFQLKENEQAIEAFKQVIAMNPGDLPSTQFLAKIYLRKGDLDSAEEAFTFLADNDKTGTFTAFAKSQLEVIRKLKETSKNVVGLPGRKISPEDFLKTKAAEHFVNAQYAEALTEMEALEQEHPDDILVKRYKGLTLDKLGRYEDAMAAYREGLTIVPDNIAIHYFMAQTFFHEKEYEKAKAELEYVIQEDSSGAYKKRAEADLQAIQKIIDYLKTQPKPKRWSLSLSTGQEYNTNASSESRFTPSITEEHSWKFPSSLGFNYDLAKKGPWSVRFSYNHSNAYYAGLENLNVLAHTLSFSVTYIGMVANKPFITQIAPAFSHATVDRKYYSSSYPESITFVYSLWDWHRIIVTERFTMTDYKSEGTASNRTSREGIANSVDINNNIYFDKEKKSYFQMGTDFGLDETVGSNFVKNFYTLRGNLFFPLFNSASGSLKFKFKRSDYPETTSNIQRLDEEYALGGSIAIPLNANWTLTPNYTYTNTNSTDNTFTYINHAGGASLSCNF